MTSKEAAFFRDADPWGFILFARNIQSAPQIIRLCADLREAVGWHAPILIDQEGGRVQRLRGPQWQEHQPPLDMVTATSDPERAMWLRGALIGAELSELGIDVNCAPLLDVAQPDTHPFLYNRCYGTDPEKVAVLGRAHVDGMAAAGVAPVMKHLPGHGRGTSDSHLELPRVSASRAELDDDFAPFRALSDLSMAMTAHIVMEAIDPQACATHSPAVIAVIREDIGFDGLLMSDDVSMEALDGTILSRAEKSIAAGCDLVLHCNGDLGEMAAIAKIGKMTGPAHERSDRAATARPKPQGIDIPALAAEFDRLTR
ncbi:glycoside hydrolase family 3 N-terminal domain-containing protein [Celeribacter arenosi]|uniref:glycoside hydrolase family 3 N-terminal domain-containing protein n=1 Tax=Celeribacter arenosi TaxID=792649 RepID=UPI0031D5AD53